MSQTVHRKFVKCEQGFTLIEVLAAVIIMSVISLAVIKVNGSGNMLLYRQSKQMDIRASARSILDKMVKDVELAKAIQVPPPVEGQLLGPNEGNRIELMDKDDQDNWYVKMAYGFDPVKHQIYLEDQDQKKVFLINAINWVAYTPLSDREENISNRVTMTLTINTANNGNVQANDQQYQMEFTATATCRSDNTNSTGLAVIRSVAPNPARFHDVNQVQMEILGQYTHFSVQSQVLLVPHGTGFDLKLYETETGRYQGENLPAGIILFDNPGNSTNIISAPPDVGGNVGATLRFTLQKQQVVDGAVYDIFVFTPMGSKTEKVFKYSALLTTWQDGGAVDDDEGGNDDSPGDEEWNESDWVIDRGSVNGFGTIEFQNNQIVIEKKSNDNDKIAYYNQRVTSFDYEVEVRTDADEIGEYALLTLFYNGENNQNSGWYIGFGINKSGVYYGQKDGINEKLYTLTNGEAKLRVKVDSVGQSYRLRLWVNDELVKEDTSIDTSIVTQRYFGVTVTDTKTQAEFTVTRN